MCDHWVFSSVCVCVCVVVCVCACVCVYFLGGVFVLSALQCVCVCGDA